MLERAFKGFSRRARARRGALFLERFRPTPDDRILDLGSEDGSYLGSLIPFRSNVFLADISRQGLERARRRYGFEHTVQLQEDAPLPFPDRFFDIVFCSSVIEHVTGAKDRTRSYRTTGEFEREALVRQRQFAQEIRRIAKRYFVQTPNRYFLVESHSWLPGAIVFLPRPIQVRIIDLAGKVWLKRTQPDWHLLTRPVLQDLFPDAEIVAERALGMTKSLLAIRA